MPGLINPWWELERLGERLMMEPELRQDFPMLTRLLLRADVKL